MQLSFPPQISRLGLIAVLGLVAYLVARHFLVPASFGQYGWYRADALKEIAATEPIYAGREACAECHSEIAAKKAGAKHKTVACESCHGAALSHAADPMAASPEKIEDPTFCLRCHEASPSRPAGFPTVRFAEHYSDGDCAKCHQPHSPEESP